MNNNHLVLSGTMRSGTTLMGAILNAHPDITIASDTLTWFFKRCYKQFGTMQSEFELENMFYQMEPFMRHHKNSYDYCSLKNQVSLRGKVSYDNLYRSLIELETSDELNKFYGIKSTHATFEYEKMIDYDPNTKIIHMVRDIHDVYSSHKKFVGAKKNEKVKKNIKSAIKSLCRLQYSIDERYFQPLHFKNPEKMIDYWYVSNKQAIEFEKRYPKNIKIVKYEDLLENIEDKLKEVISFIGAEWNNEFYQYSNLKDRNSDVWKANSSFDDTKRSSYDKSIIGRGKKRLSNTEKKLISKKCSEILKKLSYEMIT